MIRVSVHYKNIAVVLDLEYNTPSRKKQMCFSLFYYVVLKNGKLWVSISCSDQNKIKRGNTFGIGFFNSLDVGSHFKR